MGKNLKNEVKWEFRSFGTNSTYDDKLCGFRGSAQEDDVRVYCEKNSGKIVPLSYDGLSFYYTSISRDKNFTLKAKMHINDWSFTNGQEGFGLMACDRIGETGGADLWNNSIMALVTKGQYFYDAETDSYKGNADENKVVMFQGVSALARYGVTPENEQLFKDDPSTAMARYFFQDQTMLEHICAKQGAGTYNIAANYVQPHEFDETKMGVKDYGEGKLMAGAENTPEELIYEDFIFTITKDNSGYTLTYESPDGKHKGSKTYFDPKYYKDGLIREDLEAAEKEQGILEKLDSDFVHVGFFAARNADVSFSDISIEIRDRPEDEPTRAHDKVFYENNSGFISAQTANTEDYVLTYRPAWNGKLKVTGEDGVIFDGEAQAEVNTYVKARLKPGFNRFTAEFTPDENYHHGYDEIHPENIYNCLDSYETLNQELSVIYRKFSSDEIYVSPDGQAEAAGTAEDPVDIRTAVSYAAPGQAVLLKPGVYEFTKKFLLERGIDGTAENPIVLKGDGGKAVFDFKDMEGAGRLSGAFFITACYWHISDIEIMNAPDRNTGIWLAGHHNVLERLEAHHNGNVGICILAENTMVRRDERDINGEQLWPNHNTIKDCVSYENCDSGGDLADGFACKLMAGDGNAFVGCVSYSNADDGFDLYTKSELGSIGRVRIENCVSYENGYVHRNGERISAGNGNGFKLGGESIPGDHMVIKCVAYKNKADGYDSNRCPDPKLYDCLAYDNEKSNFDLYSTKGKATNFFVERCVSFRTDKTVGRGDIIKCGGDQKLEDAIGEDVVLWKLNEE
ncbi:MAG: right-handed parallel beta-helix repeat-containing protein [Lachnospiraceae bacterium]|nr:right-handed parallel beta-helix repeat-containing protein [Lachnospiraceae bacterium]